MERKG